MTMIKKLWAWLWGGVKTVLMAVVEAVGKRTKEITDDTELVQMCVNAIEAAVKEGLTGEKAWVYARDNLVAALKKAGRQMGDCAIDTALQVIYDGWKHTQEAAK